MHLADLSTSEQLTLSLGIGIRAPFWAGGLIFQPRDDLRNNIAAEGFDGAGLMKM